MAAEVMPESGIQVVPAASGEELLAALSAGEVDLLMLDLAVRDHEPLALLGQIRYRFPGLPVIMMALHPSVEQAVTAMRLGAVDFLRKPLSPAEVASAVSCVLVNHRTNVATRIATWPYTGRSALTGGERL
jgi:DNA-binding NtrC family response regulator